MNNPERYKEADATDPQRWMDELLLMLHVQSLNWDTKWGQEAFGEHAAATIEQDVHWIAVYSQRLNTPSNYRALA